MSLSLVLAAILLSLASGLPALVIPRKSAWGERAFVALQALAAVAGLSGACLGLFEGAARRSFPWPATGGGIVGMDPLSAFFLFPIFLVGGLGALYGSGYMPAARNPRTGRRLSFFYGLLVAGLALLVVARHAFSFLLGWEAMALSAFFLVGIEDGREESRRASLVYIVATHVGTLALFAMFILWRLATGSFALERDAAMSAGAASGIFFVALLGFGLKAGMMPLHFWLPGAHAAAPSHASAMLSGVVLKMGVYGLLRTLSLLPYCPPAWGALILALGAASALFGVVFALAQHDLKKLLAYHSVENVGIILMGLGVAALGRATGRGELLVLGLAGCLLHTWNHSLFKSLLFFGAGSVVRATGTRAIDRLGGLAKAMPWTASLFVAGAVAICGLPPLNGFVSELFVYLGLFNGLVRDGAGGAFVAASASVLAMVGALAVACFVKASGAVFLGSARGPEAARAREAPASMIAPMLVLAALCAFIGAAPWLFEPILESVIATWAGAGNAAGAAATAAAVTEAGAAATAVLPRLGNLAPLRIVGVASIWLLAVAALSVFLFARGARIGKDAPKRPTWDCGYAAPTGRMQYSSSSFARGLTRMFSWLLKVEPEPGRIEGQYPAPATLRQETEDGVLDRVLLPGFRRMEGLSRWSHRFQQGLAQHYVAYILIALVVLLCTLLPFDRIVALLVAG